jgi:hypothetical protein
VTSRVVGIVLLVVGIAATLFGLGARLFWEDDDGHHDGRAPTFALDAAVGADVLVVEQDGSVVSVSVERAGQRITSFDELHDSRAHVFVVGTDLDSYQHVDMADSSDGVVEFDVANPGEYRVVFQAAPSSGPDLLELGATVALVGSSGGAAGGRSDPVIADGDVWTDGSLTIERQGLDFVLSEPWDGESYHGGPAFLSVVHADEMAYVHGHAELVGDDTFRFGLDVPGRGDYLAALEFVQDGEPVTALFRFTL